MADPPAVSRTQLSSVSSESAPNVQHLNIWWGKKYLIWFHSAKTLPAKKCEKIPFPGRRQRVEKSQESCFWFMLNCTLNTEQYSCPFFIPFTAPTSHSHIQDVYTHPAHFKSICTLLFQTASSYTHWIKRNTLISCIDSEFRIYFWMCCSHCIGPPCYVINPCSNSSCFCCGVTFTLTVYLACTLQSRLCQQAGGYSHTSHTLTLSASFIILLLFYSTTPL